MNNRHSAITDLAYIAVFAALIIVLAFVYIPSGTPGVPIVLQNAAIILAGLILGARRGFLATALFLFIGLIGLPVLAGGRTTLAALAGPTAGYLVGYLVAAFLAGLIAYRAPRNNRGAMIGFFLIAGLVGLLAMYTFGVFGLMLRAGMDMPAAIVAQAPFVIPDLIKTAVMVFIAVGVHAAFPQLRGTKAKAKANAQAPANAQDKAQVTAAPKAPTAPKAPAAEHSDTIPAAPKAPAAEPTTDTDPTSPTNPQTPH